MSKNNEITAYSACEDEDAKMDFLSDYDKNPPDEFVDFLLNEFNNEDDEFLQIEIIKFISTHRKKSYNIKNFLLKNIQTLEKDDEMLLSHLVQNLVLFELREDDFKIIFEKIIEENERSKKQGDFLSSLIRLLYINCNEGAKAYLETLKEKGISFNNPK